MSIKWVLGTSLVAPWLRIQFPMQGTPVRSLIREVRSHMLCSQKKKEKKTEWISVLASPFPFGCDFASMYLSFPFCARGILTAPTYGMCCVDQMSSFKSLERFLAHRKCLVFAIFYYLLSLYYMPGLVLGGSQDRLSPTIHVGLRVQWER